jgi:hypothetical protein
MEGKYQYSLVLRHKLQNSNKTLLEEKERNSEIVRTKKRKACWKSSRPLPDGKEH